MRQWDGPADALLNIDVLELPSRLNGAPLDATDLLFEGDALVGLALGRDPDVTVYG
jgi:hypothetical protein